MCGVEVPFGFSYVPTIHIGGGGGGGGSGGGYVEKLMWCTVYSASSSTWHFHAGNGNGKKLLLALLY